MSTTAPDVAEWSCSGKIVGSVEKEPSVASSVCGGRTRSDADGCSSRLRLLGAAWELTRTWVVLSNIQRCERILDSNMHGVQRVKDWPHVER